jgi:hypothetical protein
MSGGLTTAPLGRKIAMNRAGGMRSPATIFTMRLLGAILKERVTGAVVAVPGWHGCPALF